MIRYFDKDNRFVEYFNERTGMYMRSGILKDKKDTGVDPFCRNFPALLDVGIMGHCIHGKTGLCEKAGIECYQNGKYSNKSNMTVEDFKTIAEQCNGKCFQFALGGCGDPDQHEHFEEILKICRANRIIPNYTTSGLGMTAEIAELSKKYCGAVAVSMYSQLDLYPQIAFRQRGKDEEKKPYASRADIPTLFTLGNTNKNCYFDPNRYYIDNEEFDFFEEHHLEGNDLDGRYELYRVFDELTENAYTFKAINLLLNANVRTNIHFVLSKHTIHEAITRLKYNGFPEGINAVIFLLHKPIGQGTIENVLKLEHDNECLKEFFNLVENKKFPFKIGFDSCTVPGLINMTKTVNSKSYDTCEAGRFSGYITSDMKMLPCSFDNQEQKWAVNLRDRTIAEAWNSDIFEDFRNNFRNACLSCSHRKECLGGCPICSEIVLCKNRNNI